MRECNKNVKYEEKVLPQMKNAFANEGNFQCGGREAGGHWSASYKPSYLQPLLYPITLPFSRDPLLLKSLLHYWPVMQPLLYPITLPFFKRST